MYSAYNEGKSVVAERFIRILKNETYKHITAISIIVYFNVLDDIVDEYNNTYHEVRFLRFLSHCTRKDAPERMVKLIILPF